MTHNEAEALTRRIHADIEASRDGLVNALFDHISTAARLASDLTALDDVNAPDIIARLDRFFGKHMTALADVATLAGLLSDLDDAHKTAADLEAEEIAAAEDLRADAWERRNRDMLDVLRGDS